ncbi:MAG TPA: methyltransferase domain-containing protein [Chloroflexota bacterium]|nr:methyltransferase domain-containing protein [Chloroflexota bacterium]
MSVTRVHAGRTAARDAAFFLPHVRPGMRLLDVGCGPGTITLGLAKAVRPAEVVGVDAVQTVLEDARQTASSKRVANVRFEQADAYKLPFPDRSFGAVFAHTLLEHLREPQRALAEMVRVLSPGGMIGLRDCDWGTGVFAPEDPSVRRAAELYARLWGHNGGAPHCGRTLQTRLLEAGCARVVTSASFRWDGTVESSRRFGELLADRLPHAPMATALVELGWADRNELERLAQSCRAWARHPAAFAVMVMCEAVGWIP